MRTALAIYVSAMALAALSIILFAFQKEPPAKRSSVVTDRVREVIIEAEAKMNQAMSMLPGDPIGAAMLNSEVKGMLRAAQIVNSEDKP